jgi:transcriptional regulator with XRE-family HTH domain
MLPYPAMQDWRIFGRTVRRFRQQRRLTQEELAFEAETDLTHVGGIGRDKRNSTLIVMARIADALSLPLTRLLSECLLLGRTLPLVSRKPETSRLTPWTDISRIFPLRCKGALVVL